MGSPSLRVDDFCFCVVGIWTKPATDRICGQRVDTAPEWNSAAENIAMMERFSTDTVERLSGALGAAVLKIWGQLPHDFQHKIFEEAVISSGEAIRSNLAQLLHSKHPRTSAAVSAQAIPEPDSLGG